MPATVIPLSEAGGWVARVGRQMPEAAKRGLLAAAIRLAGHVRQLEQPTDRGVARAGWRAEKTDDGAVVFNNVLEATLYEYGVRAEHVKIGRRMIDALTEWAKRKGLGARYVEGKKRGTVDFGTGKARTEQTVQRRVKPSDEVLKGIAWAVAKSMQKKGIFSPERGGLRILERATRKMAPDFVRQEVAREIKRSFGL